MALNSIGNITYINQASSATSALQANNITHPIPVNHAIFNEQMQRVEEVRPTEETHKTEEREGNAKREFEEKDSNNEETQDFQTQMEKSMKNAKKKQDDRIITEDEMLMQPENHILDIKG